MEAQPRSLVKEISETVLLFVMTGFTMAGYLALALVLVTWAR